MKWRPDDWVADLIVFDVIIENQGLRGGATLPDLVEAGADTILEKLKQKGQFQRFHRGSTPDGCKQPKRQRGWLVFIPEK